MDLSKLYIVKMPDGTLTDPVNEQTLVQMTQDNKVTPQCLIRTTLINNWSKPDQIPCIKPLIKEQIASNIEKQYSGLWHQIKNRICLKEQTQNFINAIGGKSIAGHTPSLSKRLSAALIDNFILFIFAALLFLLVTTLVSHKILAPHLAFILLANIFWGAYLLYFTLFLSLAQTPGQQLIGILLLKNDDSSPLPARCFAYALLLPFVGLLTIPAINFFGLERSLQETLTGTHLIDTTC